jgi:hypothetical protein
MKRIIDSTLGLAVVLAMFVVGTIERLVRRWSQ